MTEVINETDYEINEAEFSALADYVLDQMHVSSDAEVNIIFIEPEPMEDLHVRWLDLPGPTPPARPPSPATAPPRRCSSWPRTACCTSWATITRPTPSARSCSPSSASSS